MVAGGKRADDRRRNLKARGGHVDVSLPDTNGAGPYPATSPPLDGVYHDRRTGVGRKTTLGKAGRAK